jgi:hypothetical protein
MVPAMWMSSMACHAAHHANEKSSRLCTALGRDKGRIQKYREGKSDIVVSLL